MPKARYLLLKKILLTRERFYTGGFILSWLLASISNLNAVYETNFLKESGYETLVYQFHIPSTSISVPFI